MRILHVIFAGCWLFSTLAAAPSDLRAVISAEAAKCAAAVHRQDHAVLVSYLPARVVQKSGGRARMISELKGQFAEARNWGADRIEVIPGKPAAPKPIAKWLAGFLPVTAIVHGPHIDLTQDTHVLALSSDNGAHWSFVPMYQTTQAQLNDWFPEFRGRVIVPTAPKPRLNLVY